VANTQRNIETIGLLGGSLSADGSAFNINTLIIPKQKGETDRVEMLKEEEIWDIFFEVATSCCSLRFVLVSAAMRLPKMAYQQHAHGRCCLCRTVPRRSRCSLWAGFTLTQPSIASCPRWTSTISTATRWVVAVSSHPCP
jgi:hypothetical protein